MNEITQGTGLVRLTFKPQIDVNAATYQNITTLAETAVKKEILGVELKSWLHY